jgi:glyoxylase-like metal-dependent hydrolase (beta-lactamase superfamily II)
VQRFAARTPTLPPATTTNSYALGTRQLLLVEPATPFEDEQRAWLEWARALMGQGHELVAIFATHHHPDHVGGARFFADALALPLWAHTETAQRIDVRVTRLLADGERLLLDGPEPQAWQCLHTPGHAPGHLCLYESEQRILIAGDMVASEGTILIEPTDGDMAVYLAQLERLATLGARMALPAHGTPIDEPEALFRHYIAHRLMREQRVFAALQSADTLDELLALAYDDTNRMLWPIARLSLEAHLIKLEREGRARHESDRWRVSR